SLRMRDLAWQLRAGRSCDRQIRGDTELGNRNTGSRTVDPPEPISIDRYVFRPIAVIVSGNGDVCRDPENYAHHLVVGTVYLVPRAVCRTINRDVRFTVTVIITGNKFIAGLAENLRHRSTA